VHLPRSNSGVVVVAALLVPCLDRAGVVHEIGLAFDKPINMHEVVDADPFEECFSVEQVNPEELNGNILYVEDSAMDARLLMHFTRMTKLNVTIATNASDAVAAAAKGMKAILVDFHLPDCDAPTLVSQLRAADVKVPVIAVTSDASRATKERLAASGMSAFLAKPLTEERVLRAIAEFLLCDRWVTAESNSDMDNESREVMKKAFVEELQQIKEALVNAICDNASMDVYAMIGRLGSSAKPLGFADIGLKADIAAASLSKTMACAASKRELDELMAVIAKHLK